MTLSGNWENNSNNSGFGLSFSFGTGTPAAFVSTGIQQTSAQTLHDLAGGSLVGSGSFKIGTVQLIQGNGYAGYQGGVTFGVPRLAGSQSWSYTLMKDADTADEADLAAMRGFNSMMMNLP